VFPVATLRPRLRLSWSSNVRSFFFCAPLPAFRFRPPGEVKPCPCQPWHRRSTFIYVHSPSFTRKASITGPLPSAPTPVIVAVECRQSPWHNACRSHCFAAVASHCSPAPPSRAFLRPAPIVRLASPLLSLCPPRPRRPWPTPETHVVRFRRFHSSLVVWGPLDPPHLPSVLCCLFISHSFPEPWKGRCLPPPDSVWQLFPVELYKRASALFLCLQAVFLFHGLKLSLRLSRFFSGFLQSSCLVPCDGFWPFVPGTQPLSVLC
jgi:hypothetical protein